MFYLFEPVLYLDPVSKFPETTERPGHFVGFAELHFLSLKLHLLSLELHLLSLELHFLSLMLHLPSLKNFTFYV
jgi:hypothetical protein